MLPRLLRYVTGGAVIMAAGGAVTWLTSKQPNIVNVRADRKYDVTNNYPRFTSSHTNHMSACLTPEMYARLKDRVTSGGFTLDRCIQPGVDMPGATTSGTQTAGCVAGDHESYHVFSELFDCVISARHPLFLTYERHPHDLDFTKLRGGDFDENYVISTRIRTGRTIEGLPLPPGCTRADRREVEKVMKDILSQLRGEFKVTYYPLSALSKPEQEMLVSEHFLFERPEAVSLMTSGGMTRDWPDARGIWMSDDRGFLVWINEEDHVRMISLERGGDARGAACRLARGVGQVEEAAREAGRQFAWDPALGYILTSPSNLGTGIRASVHIKLPYLSKDPRFNDILSRLLLEKRGVGGEMSPSTGEVCDVSNIERLGKTEVQLVQVLIDGVNKLIQIEKCLEKGENIENILPE